MAPKRLLLLAASVVAALDADAPSLVSDCTVPASAYAVRACAAERLNLAHGDPALRPLPEEESMRGVISAIGGPRSACVECLSAIDAIAGRRRRLAPSSKRAVYKEPLNRKLVVDRAAAADHHRLARQLALVGPEHLRRRHALDLAGARALAEHGARPREGVAGAALGPAPLELAQALVAQAWTWSQAAGGQPIGTTVTSPV